MAWKFHRVSDGREFAEQHVLSQMSAGAVNHPLSSRLLSRELVFGDIWVISVPDLNWEEARDISFFRDGPSDSSYRTQIDKLMQNPGIDVPYCGLLAFIESYLIATPDRMVVVENFSRKVSAYAAERLHSKTVFASQYLYHIIEISHVGTANVEDALRDANSHFLMGVMTAYQQLHSETDMSDESLDQIVKHTSHVFTKGFDGEGYLLALVNVI